MFTVCKIKGFDLIFKRKSLIFHSFRHEAAKRSKREKENKAQKMYRDECYLFGTALSHPDTSG